MTRSILTLVRSWRARRQHWDADIVRALRLPVPLSVQDRARELIENGRRTEAINEIRAATGYDRRDARCIALALMYAWKMPTSRPKNLSRRSSA